MNYFIFKESKILDEELIDRTMYDEYGNFVNLYKMVGLKDLCSIDDARILRENIINDSSLCLENRDKILDALNVLSYEENKLSYDWYFQRYYPIQQEIKQKERELNSKNHEITLYTDNIEKLSEFSLVKKGNLFEWIKEKKKIRTSLKNIDRIRKNFNPKNAGILISGNPGGECKVYCYYEEKSYSKSYDKDKNAKVESIIYNLKNGEEIGVIYDTSYIFVYDSNMHPIYHRHQLIPFKNCTNDFHVTYETVISLDEETLCNIVENYFKYVKFWCEKYKIFDYQNNSLKYIYGTHDLDGYIFNVVTYNLEHYPHSSISKLDEETYVYKIKTDKNKSLIKIRNNDEWHYKEV